MSNSRRARKRGAEVAGPVPRSVYLAIRNDQQCVYCGDKATTVDHVRPLSRGGSEHESNLVAACRSCNFSKKTRLLTEWDEVKVRRAVEVSANVAAEWERLTVTR